MRHTFLKFAAISVLVSSTYLMVFGHEYAFEQNDYTVQTFNLLSRHSFRDGSGIIKDFYPPVVPCLFAAILAFSRSTHLPAEWIYVLISVGELTVAMYFLYRIAALSVREASALIAAVLFITCPFIQYGILHLASEPTFIALLYPSIYFLLRGCLDQDSSARPFIYSGILLAGALLTRPAGLFFPFLFAASILGRRGLMPVRRAARTAAFLVPFLLILFPWEYAISIQRGRLVPLSTAGPTAMADGFSFYHKPYRTQIPMSSDMQKLSVEFGDHFEKFHFYSLGYLKAQFVKAPRPFLKLVTLKARRAWYGTDRQDPRQEALNLVLVLAYLTFAAVGLREYLRRSGDRLTLVLFSMMVAVTWAMTTLALSILRYMSPVLALLFVFTAIGINRVFESVTNRKITWSTDSAIR